MLAFGHARPPSANPCTSEPSCDRKTNRVDPIPDAIDGTLFWLARNSLAACWDERWRRCGTLRKIQSIVLAIERLHLNWIFEWNLGRGSDTSDTAARTVINLKNRVWFFYERSSVREDTKNYSCVKRTNTMVPIPLSNEEIDCSFIDSSDVLVILSHLDWITAGLSTASSASATASASPSASAATIRRRSTFRSLLFYNLVHTNFFITFHLFNHTHKDLDAYLLLKKIISGQKSLR